MNVNRDKKIKENYERRRREEVLRKIPDFLMEQFSSSNYKYSDEVYKNLIYSPFANYENGELVTKNNFKLYTHIEYDNPSHILTQLNSINFQINQPFLLQISDSPFFIIEDYENFDVTKLLYFLFENNFEDYYKILSSDLKTGIFIENYVGYIEETRMTNTHEVVYEITTWIV